jgi:hypothetical protein
VGRAVSLRRAPDFARYDRQDTPEAVSYVSAALSRRCPQARARGETGLRPHEQVGQRAAFGGAIRVQRKVHPLDPRVVLGPELLNTHGTEIAPVRSRRRSSPSRAGS